MSAENKAFVKRWFDEVWNEGKPGAIEDMMKPHAIVHGLGPEPMRGPEAFKPFHAAYRNAFPDVHVQLEDLVSEGDRVAFRYTVTATHTGDGIGVPPTGKKVKFEGMGIIRVRDGDLVEGWNVFDQFGMMQQLGAVPAQ